MGSKQISLTDWERQWIASQVRTTLKFADQSDPYAKKVKKIYDKMNK